MEPASPVARRAASGRQWTERGLLDTPELRGERMRQLELSDMDPSQWEQPISPRDPFTPSPLAVPVSPVARGILDGILDGRGILDTPEPDLHRQARARASSPARELRGPPERRVDEQGVVRARGHLARSMSALDIPTSLVENMLRSREPLPVPRWPERGDDEPCPEPQPRPQSPVRRGILGAGAQERGTHSASGGLGRLPLRRPATPPTPPLHEKFADLTNAAEPSQYTNGERSEVTRAASRLAAAARARPTSTGSYTVPVSGALVSNSRSKGAGRSPRVTTGAVFADAAIQRSTFLVLQDERQRALMHNRDVVRDWGRATVDVGAASLGRRKEGLRPNVELLQQRGQRLMGQLDEAARWQRQQWQSAQAESQRRAALASQREAQASRLSEPRPGSGNPAKPSRRQGKGARLTSGGSAAEPRDKLQLRPEVGRYEDEEREAARQQEREHSRRRLQRLLNAGSA